MLQGDILVFFAQNSAYNIHNQMFGVSLLSFLLDLKIICNNHVLSLFHNTRLQWRSLREFHSEYSGKNIPSWLLDKGSMTQHLRGCCADLKIQVLSHSSGSPLLHENRILGVSPRRYALIREINMLCDGVICIFGRTIIPPRTLIGKGCVLKHLGEKPLGAILFSDPALKRGEFEIAFAKPDPCYFKSLKNPKNSLGNFFWARRSIFYFYGKPLLLMEIFAPIMS